MLVLGHKEQFRAFIAIASEYPYRSALSVGQAPQHQWRARDLTMDRLSTIKLTRVVDLILAALTASQREVLSLPAISL